MSFLSFDPIVGGMFSDAPDYEGMAQSKEKKRQAAITKGTTDINAAFSGFDPAFYAQRQKAYTDFAMPQVASQYRDQAASTGFNLANRNLTGSAYGKKQWSNLNRTMAGAKQQVADTALSQSQTLQQQINDQQNKLLSNLYSSADPAQAQQSALATASQFSGPSAFAPVANMFGGLLNQYLASQAMNTYRPQTAIQTVSPYQSFGGGLPSTYTSVTNR